MKTKSLSAVALIAGSASCANAAVVSFVDVDIPIPTTYAGVSLNLETGVFENDLDGVAGGDVNFIFGGEWITNDADEGAVSPTWQPVRVGSGNSDTIANLGIGSIVGPAPLPPGLDYSTGYGGSVDHITPTPPTPLRFESGVTGYIGFSMDVGAASPVYGWMEVTLQDDNTPGTIHSWAYQDDGTPLAVGAIPEPSQSILVMMGVLATALRRRRVGS